MIEFKQVSVEFNNGRNDIKAVTNVSFTINDGEIFGIVGSSGAGKSTLLRTINGLERPTKGEVLIDGNAINQLYSKELSKVRSHIGMIFQQFNLINSKTVAQNIAFPLQVAGKSRGEIEKRVDELLEIVELKDKKYEHPSKLSGGQKQRVGIARALGYINDFIDKVQKASEIKGTSYIHVVAPCPTGWGIQTDDTVEIAKEIVDCGLWYLAEYENGEFKLNKNPKEFSPVEAYLKKQGRFKHLNEEDILEITSQRDKKWQKIRRDWTAE